MPISDTLAKCREKIREAETVEYSGKVVKVVGLTVESNGPTVNMGDVCRIYASEGEGYVEAEVVGFKDQRVQLMPFGDMTGIGLFARSPFEFINGQRYRMLRPMLHVGSREQQPISHVIACLVACMVVSCK